MRVTVRTGCRLHAGFYYAGLDWGVRWGGLGFYADRPRVVVEASRCDGLRLSGFGAREPLVRRALGVLGVNGVCLEAKELIPAHVGLGSTTQLLLAATFAASYVEGLKVDPLDLAVRLGRGRVSWVGSLLFKFGGFVMDAGSPSPRGPRALTRLEVPEDWVFVIVTPALERGFSEVEESSILTEPWEPSLEASYHMSRGALRLASAIARGDLREALEGLREVQLGTGLYFSSIQGGVYRGSLNMVVEEARSRGVILAQSSWGPTLYTIADYRDADSIVDTLEGVLRTLNLGGFVAVSKPRNEGASLQNSL
jgi:beta-ribofuranosylaminobenzene 5'-phosphate synthase